MDHVTLTLAVILGVGLAAAQIGKLFKLPSVTGYILAGLLLGPSGSGLISEEISSEKLGHFTEIALMLVAFGIGEHIEFKEIRKVARSVGFIGLAETSCAFVLVTLGCFVAAAVTGIGGESWQYTEYAALAVLLGAVAVATAPAATLHVLRELGARGPLTSTLIAVVAIDDGIAIIYFGLAMALVSNLPAGEGGSLVQAILISFQEITFSLLLGAATGLLIDFLLHRLKTKGEMLSAGLALLLLCGESSRLLHLSPLLAGMAAGCVIVNRDKRDVRFFMALRDFEPPIYILFFTLAGIQLHISALAGAGLIGLFYFLLRITGKIVGSYLGARQAGSPVAVQRYLGFGLAPQAGVAIGLVFLIAHNESLHEYSEIITPVVLAGVVLSELVGPLLARFAVGQAGEIVVDTEELPTIHPGLEGLSAKEIQDRLRSLEGISIVPWTWPQLTPVEGRKGVVAFGAGHPVTVRGLARFATIFANHFAAEPMSIRVVPSDREIQDENALFQEEEEEVNTLGYPLIKNLVKLDEVTRGINEAVCWNDTRCLLLGYPIHGTMPGFDRVVEEMARQAECAVVVVRFYGELHTERILVPFVSMDQLEEVGAFVNALAKIGEHEITLLRILPYGHSKAEYLHKEKELNDWLRFYTYSCRKCVCRLVSSDARVDTILREAEGHDLIVMSDSSRTKVHRLLFGSLAGSVVKDCRKPILIVHYPD